MKMSVSGKLGIQRTGGDNRCFVSVTKEGEGQKRSEYAVEVEGGGMGSVVEMIDVVGKDRSKVRF